MKSLGSDQWCTDLLPEVPSMLAGTAKAQFIAVVGEHVSSSVPSWMNLTTCLELEAFPLLQSFFNGPYHVDPIFVARDLNSEKVFQRVLTGWIEDVHTIDDALGSLDIERVCLAIKTVAPNLDDYCHLVDLALAEAAVRTGQQYDGAAFGLTEYCADGSLMGPEEIAARFAEFPDGTPDTHRRAFGPPDTLEIPVLDLVNIDRIASTLNVMLTTWLSNDTAQTRRDVASDFANAVLLPSPPPADAEHLVGEGLSWVFQSLELAVARELLDQLHDAFRRTWLRSLPREAFSNKVGDQ